MKNNGIEGGGIVWGCLPLLIAVIVGAVLLSGCVNKHTTVIARQVIVRERISNRNGTEAWQECLYSLGTIRYDTIRRKGYDTAHELPR